jgi:hypothetical protein
MTTTTRAPSSDRDGIVQTIRALKGSGWVLVGVYDGGDGIEAVSTEAEAVEAIMAVDDAFLYVAEGTQTGLQRWVRYVMGNEPFDVICDHHVGLSSVLDPLTDGWS